MYGWRHQCCKHENLNSWLLSEEPIFPRTSDNAYTDYVETYLRELFSHVRDLQFYTASGQTGGPIIMVQVKTGTVLANLTSKTNNYVLNIAKNRETKEFCFSRNEEL